MQDGLFYLYESHILTKFQTIMKTIFESRFMEVATAGMPCQMTNEELTTEFYKFQNDVLGVLMSDRGYPAIDFTLRDLLAQLEGVVCGKKK